MRHTTIYMMVVVSSMLGLIKWSVVQKELFLRQNEVPIIIPVTNNVPVAVAAVVVDDDNENLNKQLKKATDSDEDEDIDKDEDKSENKEKELTLERLFPEKSFFGPSAYSTAFSNDGKYAAYLYRPYKERRHGSDLWIYNVETGETQRVTSVSVMSKFQEATRKVKEDRIEKAGKKGKSGDKSQADIDNSVTGEWHGILTGKEEFDIPPEGVAFILSLDLEADGLTIGGTFRSKVANATITKGNYNTDENEITCTLTDPETGLTGALTASLDNKNATMTGTIVTKDPEATFEFTAQRMTPPASNKKAETEDEQADDNSDDKDKDEKMIEQDEEGNDKNNKKDEDIDDDNNDDKLGDTVSDDDADDEKAPRYGGISNYQWAPETNDIIFVSGGDVYTYNLETQQIVRLTKTKERENSVQYLPDGSGYTCWRGNGVIKVTWNSHIIEQIDPQFPGGEDMASYSISPDGKRFAFVTTKGENFWNQGRQVNIVNYRQRFAQVTQVPRHMPDDPHPNVDWSVYMYEVNDPMTEKSKLNKVFSFKQTGPRDAVNGPDWALDSSRFAFVVFEQSSSLVRVLEATFPDSIKNDDEVTADDDNDTDKNQDNKKDDDKDKDKDPKIEDAKVVYEFYHNGGPNTPGMMYPYYLADNHRITLITELSGFRHLHILDPLYEQLDQITKGRYEVYPEHISKNHEKLFVTSTKEHPASLDIYSIELATGEMTRLSKEDGYYSGAAVSNNGQHILTNYIDYGKLRELVSIDVNAEQLKTLTDSHPKEAYELTAPVPEMFTFKNRHGQDIYGNMFKPDDWTPNDKRPLLIYVYGGPLGTTKMVTRGSYSSDGYFFAYYMAKKHGYVTCTIDPRGASGYGGLFEKSNYDQVGKPQVEDLVDGANWFVENQGVDKDRMAIHGWSFGGFQTQMCLYTEPDVFACGMAGAGPTEWENYNSWYSTGTIGPSREGKTDLSKFSLLPLAKNLKAKMLLVHGMEDSNVLYQDTVRVYRELLKAGKETLVELFLDPTGGHGLGGDVKRIGRMRKYEDFLIRTIGEGEPTAANIDETAAETTAGADDNDSADDDKAAVEKKDSDNKKQWIKDNTEKVEEEEEIDLFR